MQISLEQLAARVSESLKPIYVIHGEETLLKLESADAIRAAARKAGYSEREHFVVEAHFDWSLITQASDNPVSYTHLDVYKRQLLDQGDARHGFAQIR